MQPIDLGLCKTTNHWGSVHALITQIEAIIVHWVNE